MPPCGQPASEASRPRADAPGPLQLGSEGLDQLETARDPRLVPGQHHALREDVGHHLQPLDFVAREIDGFPAHALARLRFDGDFHFLGLGRGERAAEGRAHLRQKLGFFLRSHVEEHHDTVAEQHRHPASRHRYRERAGCEPFLRLPRAQLDAVRNQDGSSLEVGTQGHDGPREVWLDDHDG